MISALIFVLCVAAILQFFISYCRSLVVVYSKVELSPKARELAAAQGSTLCGAAFSGLVELLKTCPQPEDDGLEMRVVRVYYALLHPLRALGRFASPVAEWVERERAGCAHFAAVALDRRMAYHSEITT